MADQPTIAVIGAGISGLTAGKALSDRGLDYVCFDASDDVGGNWYFGNPNGRSSAYQLPMSAPSPSPPLRWSAPIDQTSNSPRCPGCRY